MNAIWYGEIKDFNTLIEQKNIYIQSTACTSEQHIKKFISTFEDTCCRGLWNGDRYETRKRHQ